MSDNQNQSSTLGGMLNQAAGAVQSAFGQVIGSGKDYSEGEQRKSYGEDQKDLSRATAKVGPVTATADGAHVDNKDRQEGSWDQTIGSGKQFIGGLTGSESLKTQGEEQYNRGVQKETQGQASDLAQGLSDRVTGTLGNISASVTGDREAQRKYQDQHDMGKAAQRSVEHDLQKKADAEQRNSGY